MPHLALCRCPRCDGELPLAKVCSTVRGFSPLLYKTGVVCPTCGVELVILMSGVVWLNSVIYVVGVGLGLLVVLWGAPRLHWHMTATTILLGIAVPYAVLLFATWRLAPWFADVRLARDDETVYYPLERGGAASNNRWRGP